MGMNLVPRGILLMGTTFQVLTDCPCPAPLCRGVPLLRSPDGQLPVVQYCANCDGPPKGEPILYYHATRGITPAIKVSGVKEWSPSHPQPFLLRRLVHGHQPRRPTSPAI